MQTIKLKTICKKVLSDCHTPVGIYLRLRDKYRDTVLLESSDYTSAENSHSIIGINAIGGIEVRNLDTIEFKFPNSKSEKLLIRDHLQVPELLWNYMQQYDVTPAEDKTVRLAQGLFGYVSYNALQFFDTLKLQSPDNELKIPYMRYRLYQYVIVINHFKNEMYLCENILPEVESKIDEVETLINHKDIPAFPFGLQDEETSNKTDEEHLEMINKGIKSCLRGDVFQIVLSRRFQQKYTGDDFNVYRALRSINPSPYLFYFDYGDYKLMGSSPESQVVIEDGIAMMHPIAGTYKRTDNDEENKKLSEALLNDPKEIAEHTMLVDLARNDLSKHCENVRVNHYKQIRTFSHVLHIVSEVCGDVKKGTNPFVILADVFPAGTLSGAPKYKAMQLIDEYEQSSRSSYGGTIGFVGFDGSFNHAIIIRSFLCKNNTLYYQAGAGIVAKSNPQSELQEVHNKLGALKQALILSGQL